MVHKEPIGIILPVPNNDEEENDASSGGQDEDTRNGR